MGCLGVHWITFDSNVVPFVGGNPADEFPNFDYIGTCSMTDSKIGAENEYFPRRLDALGNLRRKNRLATC